MNKMLLTIAIVLVIFGIIVGPVAATLPLKNPFPSAGIWNTLWGVLEDLQDQIQMIMTLFFTVSGDTVSCEN
jgi:hypothetical protein